MSKNLEMELTTTPLTMNERLVKIHENPNVYTIDSFLTESECKYITESASKSLRDSVVSAATGGVASAGRTSKTTWLCYRRDPLLKNIAERSASVFKNLLPHVEWKNFEQLQIVKYQKGQEYRWHWDAYDFDSERGKRCTAERGQRLYTILFYLSDVEEGGETGFRDISDSTNVKPLKITPQIGKALVFQNVIGKTNRRDPKSLHAGLPVLKGEKWIANFWLRELPFDKQRPRYIPTQQPQLQSQTNRTLQNTSGIDNDIPFYYSIMKSNTEHNDVHKDYKRLYSTIGYFLGGLEYLNEKAFFVKQKHLFYGMYSTLAYIL